MVDRRKAEDSVVFVLNKLNDFRSVANNLTTEEQNVVDDVSSALTDLREIVKPLDMIKPNDPLGTRKQGLDDDMHRLTQEIFPHFDRETTALHTPLHKRRPSPLVRHTSLLEILSKVKDISTKYAELLDTLKGEERPLLHTLSKVKDVSEIYGGLDTFKREEGSARKLKDVALEEGSATKRHYKTRKGSSVTKSTPGDSVLIREGDLVGFNCRKKGLIQLLLEDDYRTKDVLVTGRRGSGKTALVRKVCEDVHVSKHFGTIAWISVPLVNDPDLIRHQIFLQLLFENKVPITDHLSAFAVNDQMLADQINSLLQKERSLIVVDNIVNQSTLETFQNVSHLIDTGRVIFIARHEMGPWNRDMHWDEDELEIYKLGDLSEEESWELFHSKTFPEGDVPSPLKEVCQDIVRKCEGLPEAIVLFSHLLRNKKERNDEWDSMIPSFDLKSHLSLELELIQEVLKIIYQDDRLESCLLYLSLFPDNSQISCMRVSRLWTAEGFLGKERAESVLQEFRSRMWIHPVETRSDGRFSTFRVHNLVREIIVSLSNHRNLLMISSDGSTNWPERVGYLSVQGTVRDLNEEKLSRLCSLFVFNVSSNKDNTTTSNASLLETSENGVPFNFKLLKVLDLTGAPLQIAPDALFKLTLLRYLSFRETSIDVIPGSIEKLTYLEFLDLKHSLVTELPLEAEGLKRIRHILIYHHEKDPLMESYKLIGFKASCRVGGFKCLEKLCFVESDNSTLEDLGNLTELRRLGITKLRAGHCKLLCSSLDKLKWLNSLNLHAFDEDEIIDLRYISSPPEFLKHLYLHGHLEELPKWILSCQYLTKIILRWCQLEEDLLATLGVLSNLVELELRRAYDGRQLDFKDGQFKKLKILLLEELEGLRSMSLEKGTMPCLENLTISRCQWLETIPSGIEHIHAKKLTFFDMSHEFYETVRADHEKDDYRIIKHLPEVYFTQWRAGHWETHPFRRQTR